MNIPCIEGRASPAAAQASGLRPRASDLGPRTSDLGPRARASGLGPRASGFLDGAVGEALARGALPDRRDLALAVEDDLLHAGARGQELDLAGDLLDGAEVERREVDRVDAAAILVVDDVTGDHVVEVDAAGG